MQTQVNDGRRENFLTFPFKKKFTVSMEARHSNQLTYNFQLSQEVAYDVQKARQSYSVTLKITIKWEVFTKMQMHKCPLTIAVALEKKSAYGLGVMTHLEREPFPREEKFIK